jgi:Tfp pilus assembly protein PilO
MTATTKLLIITVSGIISCILLGFLLIKPTLQKASSLNADLLAKKTEVKTLEQQILAFRSAQADLSKVTQRDRILTAIVESEDLVAAVQDIEAAAQKVNSTHKLTIDDNQDPRNAPAPVVKNKRGVKEVPYSLSMKNSYEQLVEFLMYLEHLPHFTEISGMRIQAEVSGTAEGQLPQQTGNVNVTLDGVFFVKGEETRPAAATNATNP